MLLLLGEVTSCVLQEGPLAVPHSWVGLEIVLCSQLGSLSTDYAVYDCVGSLAGILPERGARLYLAIRQSHRMGSGTRWWCGLCSMAGWYTRLGSVAAHANCVGFLLM